MQPCLIVPTPALQYKDHSNSANPAAARQQMIMSAMVKSPEHQQGPTNLAPSNSERRKATATPEGERGWWSLTVSPLTDTYMQTHKGPHLHTHTHTYDVTRHKRIICEALTILFLSHTFQREGGSLLKVSCPNSWLSAVWSLISLLLLLPHPHPWKARF